MRATDAAGNTGATPSTYSWTLDTSGVSAGVDEVHYTFTGATSVAFDWRGSPTDIRYGVTTGYGSTATAHAPDPLPFSSAGPFREVELTGLAAGTTYHYSIGGGRDHTFSTAPTSTYRFDVVADVGSTILSSKVATVASQVAGDLPSFVLVPGDLTYGNAYGQAAVDQHFNDVMAWSQSAAYMPSWGNHESDTRRSTTYGPGSSPAAKRSTGHERGRRAVAEGGAQRRGEDHLPRVARRPSFPRRAHRRVVRTAPMTEDTEVTGPLVLNVWVSSTAEDMDIFATIRNIGPDGKDVCEVGQRGDPVPCVTKGWLRASHRKLDHEKSLPYRPYHAHDERWWLKPGEVVECQVEVWPTSMVFKKGHKLRLDIQPRDGVGTAHFTHYHADYNAGATNTLHAGGDRASYLLLPIIPFCVPPKYAESVLTGGLRGLARFARV